MSAYVLILVAFMRNEGGVFVREIPFDNRTECQTAAAEWDKVQYGAGKVVAKCHRRSPS